MAFKVGKISMKFKILGKKYFLLKISSGHIECSCENPTESSRQKSEKCLCPRSGNIYRILFSDGKCFSSNCSAGQVECSFDNLADRFLSKKCRPMSKKYFNNYFFLTKKGFLSKIFSGKVECSFDSLARKFQQSSEKWCSNLKNKHRTTIFLEKKTFFLKIFRSIRRMQFWQHCRKVFATSLIIFLKRYFYQFIRFSEKDSVGYIECSFDNYGEILWQKSEKWR